MLARLTRDTPCLRTLSSTRCDVAGVIYECEATPAVYVSILSNLGHVGDNITVQCRISGVLDHRPRAMWVKSAVGDDVEQTIAEDEKILQPYSTHGRYTATLTVLSPVTLYLMTIYCKSSPAYFCLLYTSPSPRDGLLSRMPSSA